jgi:hypothetical protein
MPLFIFSLWRQPKSSYILWLQGDARTRRASLERRTGHHAIGTRQRSHGWRGAGGGFLWVTVSSDLGRRRGPHDERQKFPKSVYSELLVSLTAGPGTKQWTCMFWKHSCTDFRDFKTEKNQCVIEKKYLKSACSDCLCWGSTGTLSILGRHWDTVFIGVLGKHWGTDFWDWFFGSARVTAALLSPPSPLHIPGTAAAATEDGKLQAAERIFTSTLYVVTFM